MSAVSFHCRREAHPAFFNNNDRPRPLIEAAADGFRQIDCGFSTPALPYPAEDRGSCASKILS